MHTVVEKSNLLETVLSYQNVSVIKRISKDMSCSFQEAKEIFDDTKLFLYLCGKYSDSFTPSPRIDEGWHAFILHTKDYFDFCMNYFQKFIHHYPASGDVNIEKSRLQVKNTLNTAYLEFETLSSNWDYCKQSNLTFALEYFDCSNACNNVGCDSCSGNSSCNS